MLAVLPLNGCGASDDTFGGGAAEAAPPRLRGRDAAILRRRRVQKRESKNENIGLGIFARNNCSLLHFQRAFLYFRRQFVLFPAMAELPKTMRALIAPNDQGPKAYIVTDFPTPRITSPDQVVVRSYAAAPGASEVVMTAGGFSLVHKLELAIPQPESFTIEGTDCLLDFRLNLRSKARELWRRLDRESSS